MDQPLLIVPETVNHENMTESGQAPHYVVHPHNLDSREEKCAKLDHRELVTEPTPVEKPGMQGDLRFENLKAGRDRMLA